MLACDSVAAADSVVGASKVLDGESDCFIEHGHSIVDSPLMREINPGWITCPDVMVQAETAR